MHIPSSAPAWEMCTGNIEYTSLRQASEWIYPLIRGKYRILIYSGDTDGAVPTQGTIMWMKDLGWKILN
jgi:hypothetical protein